ncbi:hypothetical protein [Nocardioides cavernaquae]|uniref:hypothetical protein n=1 Tax=Nocardioides cavernaquae TaxID=2321396 RepID=UPI00160144C1|nr:hypothetical protein [Nocardioides cavernaquae]
MTFAGALVVLVGAVALCLLVRDLFRLVRSDGYGSRPDHLLPRSHAESAYDRSR